VAITTKRGSTGLAGDRRARMDYRVEWKAIDIGSLNWVAGPDRSLVFLSSEPVSLDRQVPAARS
jgi:hypothetical protein